MIGFVVFIIICMGALYGLNCLLKALRDFDD